MPFHRLDEKQNESEVSCLCYIAEGTDTCVRVGKWRSLRLNDLQDRNWTLKDLSLKSRTVMLLPSFALWTEIYVKR